ncbi:MAG: sulfur carrier protein ThiS [Acidobacteriota bacterium]
MISVEVNGQRQEIPSGLNIRTLLDFLDVDPQRVAVELNRAIIRKTEWEATMLAANDQIEVVMFVGGGRG